MKLIFVFCWILMCNKSLFAQTIQILDSGKNVSLRGLSVVDENVFWCSGSKGTVVRSENAGQTLEWLKVPGFEDRDFRDIEAFDANNALIMAIGEPAVVLRTNNGGKNWQKVFEDSTKGMFLDAMDFDGQGGGFVIGDPINDSLYIAISKDFGHTWQQLKNSYKMLDGEAFFAASGTNISLKQFPIWVSGGIQSRLFYNQQIFPLAMQKGKNSCGANSFALNNNRIIVVGGDYTNDQRSDSNCVVLQVSKGIEGHFLAKGPKGYKSCVQYLGDYFWMTCGTSGIDITNDDGEHWQQISQQSFHVLQPTPTCGKIFLAGANGKLAVVNFGLRKLQMDY